MRHMHTMAVNRWDTMEDDRAAILASTHVPLGEAESSLKVARVTLRISLPNQEVKLFAVDIQGDSTELIEYRERSE